jgi:hypothetical protein
VAIKSGVIGEEESAKGFGECGELTNEGIGGVDAVDARGKGAEEDVLSIGVGVVDEGIGIATVWEGVG